jgi:ribokinase
MYDIITIGSATRDVYIQSSDLKVIRSRKFIAGEGICFSSGSKLSVEEIYFTTGGSAINTAVTFAQQGLKTSVLCKVGDDAGGLAIKSRLKEVGADTKHILTDKKYKTAYSVIIHLPSGERSIFAYRGAASHLTQKEASLSFLDSTKWIYITHLGQESAKLFRPLLKSASKRGVKIALNPGSTQLKMGKKLVPFLNYVDVLFVNKEEAAYLTGVSFKKEQKIFQKLDKWVRGIAVMTKGPEGVIVSDGETRWEAGIVKEPRFLDRTGAGDAFGSGFVSAIILGGSVEDAIRLGTANSASVLGEWGANNGLLAAKSRPTKFGKLAIKQTRA